MTIQGLGDGGWVACQWDPQLLGGATRREGTTSLSPGLNLTVDESRDESKEPVKGQGCSCGKLPELSQMLAYTNLSHQVF